MLGITEDRQVSIIPNYPSWRNRHDAYSEMFDSRLRGELLDRGVSETLTATIILKDRRPDDNHRRPITPRPESGGRSTKP
jgi:hypothetical protein